MVEYNIGDTLRITLSTYGGAVYDKKGRVINENQKPDVSVYIGVVVEMKHEGERGPLRITCDLAGKSIMPILCFYPKDNGPNQKVEVIKASTLRRDERSAGSMLRNPPHPADFGIPEKHWEAAQHYANYWHLSLVEAQQLRQVITDPAAIREAFERDCI